MDSLRIILLVVGVIFIAGIYLWETRWRKRVRDVDDLGSTYLDDLGEQRSRRDFGYSRGASEADASVDPKAHEAALSEAFQESLPFDEDTSSDMYEQAALSDAPHPHSTERNVAASSDSLPHVSADGGPALGELDFIVPSGADDDGVSEQINRLDAFAAAPQISTPSATEPGLVIALTLMARPGERFSGETVRTALETLGFRHGRMNIFHHYDRPESGRRDPLCTVANVVNPGTFELDTMDSLVTPGLALFMQVSGHESENLKLDRMLELGGRLAQALDGDLMDETRSTLTNQAINHLRERIAEFSRLQRLRR